MSNYRERPTTKALHKEISEYIERHTENIGYPPSYRDIADQTGLSLPTISYHIKKMIEAGTLTVTPGHARSLKVVKIYLHDRVSYGV